MRITPTPVALPTPPRRNRPRARVRIPVMAPEAKEAHSPADRIAAVIEGIAHAYSLTATEVEVIKLVLDGKSRAQIAELRGTSPNTVKTHVRNLLSKCGLTQTIAFRAYVYRSALYGEFLPLPSNDE